MSEKTSHPVAKGENTSHALAKGEKASHAVTKGDKSVDAVTESEMTRADGKAATVTPCENGPLLLRGTFELVTQDGEVIDPGRRTVALCRCGGSAVKPFCDGTHKAIGFQAPSEATSVRPLSST